MKRPALLLLLALAAGCAPDSDPDAERAAALVNRGKYELSQGAWSPAVADFREAAALDTGNREADYGIVLAEVRHLWGIVDLIAQFGFEEVGLPAQPAAYHPTANGEPSLDAWVEGLLVDFDATLADLTARTARLKADGGVHFKIASFPFSLRGKTYLDFGGEWDRGDAYLLDAFFRTLQAAVRLARSQQLAVGIAPLYADFVALGQEFDLTTIEGVLVRNLERHPGWLDLDGKRGAARWSESRALLAEALGDLHDMPGVLAAETDDQANDIFVLEPEKKKDLLLQQPATDRKPARFLWDGTTYSVKKSLARLQASLADDGAPRVDALNDLAVVAVAAFDAFRQSVDIEALAGNFGVDLSGTIGDVLALNFGDGEGFLAAALGIAADYLPAGLLELNLGAFFGTPAGVRELLPLWRMAPDERYAEFLLSWECPRFDVPATLQAGANPIAVYDEAAQAYAGAGNDSRSLAWSTYAGGATDALALTLGEEADREAWFSASLAVANGTPAAGDGVLSWNGAPVTTTARYADPVLPGVTYDLVWNNAARVDDWGDRNSLTCATTPHDGAHFGQEVFQAAKYPLAVYDGLAGTLPYIPFQSPSFNGLVYIDPAAVEDLSGLQEWHATGNAFKAGPAKATPRTLNLVIQAYGKVFE